MRVVKKGGCGWMRMTWESTNGIDKNGRGNGVLIDVASAMMVDVGILAGAVCEEQKRWKRTPRKVKVTWKYRHAKIREVEVVGFVN